MREIDFIMEKPESILKLEKKFHISIEMLPSKSKDRHSNNFKLDEKGEIIELNLEGNVISDTELLEDFPNLISLSLSSNMIDDISFLKNIKSLNYLDLSDNRIENIDYLKELNELVYLDLNRNKISDISALQDLKKMKTLRLWTNPIYDISFLKKLKKLQYLDIWSIKAKDFNVLLHLTQLDDLDIGSNQIKDLSFLVNLKNLNRLRARNNEITNFSVLKDLKKLTSIDLSNNKLNDISFLNELEQIEYLILSDNKSITNYSFLNSLINIKSLDLSRNQLEDISFLKDINRLTSLNLRNNNIKDVSIFKDFIHLRNLDLYENKITDIRPLTSLIKNSVELSDAYNFGLNLFNNPLEYPSIQTLKRGQEAVLRYFEKIEKEGIAPIFESKVTLVGEGSAGKTSLQKRLMNSKAILPKEDKRTRGIEVIDWNFKKTKDKIHIAHIWDFGGQDVYYPVHRFFLTENSVFVLLASSRQNTHNFEYWIPTIFQFGGKSPIILGQTCHDGNKTPWNDLGIYLASDNFNIIKDSESIYHELNLKGKKNIGLVNIKRSIINQILNLPHYKKNVPKSWLEVRDLITTLKDVNCISYIELKDKIKELNPQSFVNKEDVEDCIKFFHDIGIVLWYNKDRHLKNWVILNPSWSVDAVYKIIDDEKILNQKGIILKDDFERVWKDKKYEDKYTILKEMLEVFKIAFPKKHNVSDFIIPARLLSIPKEKIWNDTDAELHIEYEYEFMPKGMVNQISSELSRNIVSDEEVWNNGVNLCFEKSSCQIFEDFYKRKISIKTKGKDARSIIVTIMNTIKNITEEYKGVSPKIIIPCPCDICKTISEPQKFSYDNLILKLEKNKNSIVMCNNSDITFEIDKLLFVNGLPTIEKDKKDYKDHIGIRTIKIFLASSNELKEERDKFRNFISTENDRWHKKGVYFEVVQWEYFLDEISNTRLQDEYNKELIKCDIALCLFFTKVGKFTEEEFDTAYKKFKADGVPKIWTYFKHSDINVGDITEEINTLLNFKKKLKELGHFETSYKSSEDLHLKFKRQLEIYLDN